ncbi:tetratricopeptide repeat protein [Cytobacillus sp. FSL R5-0569]|uniref:tetratricopeptide repeat protein n=1 Tax=Cytobacillus sp. FSL R5-0569 TaxID=2921649 RepID=UPI0030FBD4AD
MQDEIMEALRLRKQGEWLLSNQLFLKMLESFPDDANLLYQSAWSYDLLGEERKAVPLYEKAIQKGMKEDLEGAYIGLGSTLRTLGEYEKSKAVLEEGFHQFPHNGALVTFLAMTLYNLGEHELAMNHLLRLLANTSRDESITAYQEAIHFYREQLNKTWE